MRETNILLLAILSATSAMSCTKTNPDYCNTDNDCERGLVCHVPSHACVVPADADSTPPDARLCFGTGGFAVCLRALPTEAVTLPSYTNTDSSSPICGADQLWQEGLGQKDTCFVVGTTITVPSTRVEGTRQLVLIATDSIDVIGYVDASAHAVPFVSGPGVPLDCGAFSQAPQDSDGAGGGAGASFRTGAGNGGDGGGNGAGAAGGRKNPLQGIPSILHSGCIGQNGGNGAGNGGTGGGGGGALYFVAGSTIRLASSAIINVSGAGGGTAGKSCGGGGGGSGGMILLDAPAMTVDIGAKLVANGGGGSSGGNALSAGGAGHDPDPTTPFVAALGGTGAGLAGGHGGTQTVASEAGGNAVPGTDGGGGGGGGLGYIRSSQPLTNAEVSPSPDIVP